ncbi:hypothetical protein H8784_00995 [Parabacteroides acidifaciens]|uniref:6-bladed beta-propeller n=1 Tax=Parabacteroides acidifaciens TaxID=2290935 RepID=A0A3D8HJU3_9BACT|nr:hypothetical protein [Parabacteroides acidifaciens]MBC8600297.1 hypothetical protein [Parabacteroides acidifaciens]RDU50930.1 hypothetical protein DWU89_01020 [Parabacteroides acidifaciens]
MRNLHILFLFLLLVACSEKKEGILVFPKATELAAIEYPEEAVMGTPWQIKPVGDKLLLFFPSSRDENVIKIMDAHTGKILSSWGIFGNGPGEFFLPQYWGADDERMLLYLYDVNTYRFREYKWSLLQDDLVMEQIAETPFKRDFLKPGRGARLENGNFVSAIIYGIEKPVLVMDSQLDSLTIVGDVPDDEHKTITLFDYDGRLASYGNSFVFAMSSIGYIGFYEQLPDGKIEKRWVHYTEKPVYNGTELNRKILKDGFGGVAMNDKYIFATYSGVHDSRENRQSGQVYPETILMFDHKGKLLRNFHTKGKRQTGIAISEDGKTLYATVVYPEIEIVRYDISPYIK